MKNKSENGFSYIDVMVAIVILLVGILALVSAITGAIFQARGQEEQLNAKQIASSTMESIMSVKETDPARLGWNAVANKTGPTSLGVFVTGFQPVKSDAGTDEILGTTDDSGSVIAGFERRIVITDQCDPTRPSPNCPTPGEFPVKIRLVVVTITYKVGTIQRQEVLTTVLTDYAAAN